jgi:ATP-dependent DNA helicase RecG
VPGTIVTVAVTVERHRAPPPGRARAPYLIYSSDGTGDLILVYFNARREYLEKLLPVGARRYVSGTVALYDGMLQMAHPDRVVAEAELATLPLIEPVYPLTEGLTANQVRRAIEAALGKLPALPEWQDAAFLARSGFPPFADALRRVHRPAAPDDVLAGSPAW